MLRRNSFYHYIIISLILIIYGCTNDTKKSVDLSVEAKKVFDANQAMFAGEKQRDLEKIMLYVAENAVFQFQDAPAFSGHETIKPFFLNFFKLEYTDTGGKPDTVIISTSGDMAYDIGGNYTLFDTPDGKIRSEGKYLAVWRKIEDNWKVVALSFSGNAPAK